MSHEPSHPGSRHFRAVSAPDLSTLSGAVNATYDRLDDLVATAHGHYRRLAPPLGDVPQPTTVDGTSLPPHVPDVAWVRRAALTAADGLTVTASGFANFDDSSTAFLADLGRDLRKNGITIEHVAAAAESLGRALCGLYNFPYPGTDLTYQAAEEAGIPVGLTELLQTVDLGVRIAALGAVEDEDAGIPVASDAEVLEIQQRSPRITVVRLTATPPQTGWAGQFLEARSPGDPDRWQVVASSIPPNHGGLLEFPFFHPADTPPEVSVGEHWVVANPTGGLELSADTPTLMIALGAGLAPLRALILDASTRDTVPPVHLYWQVDNPDDLHEYTGMLGLAGVFGWLTFTPVVTDATATGDAAWFDTPERERFTIYSRPGPEQLVNGEELRHGTAADVAVADNAGNTWAGRRVLVAGGPEDATAVNEAVSVLTAAGVDPAMITAESM
jgi:NAD(P)H-flavin reductase